MHDDVYTHGMPPLRSNPQVPRIIHQFWEGSKQPPQMLMQKCRDMHPGWAHRVWNNAEIRRHFPSMQQAQDGPLARDGKTGQLLNQDLYRGELNLLSDIMRYEVLMWYGGVYVDADMECVRPMDSLLQQRGGGVMDQAQAFVFLEKDRDYVGGLIGSSVIGMHAFSPLSVALTSELQRTDWSEPPWKSAGPLYLTKIIRLFDAYKKGSYLEVKVLDSFYVFPYHHSDRRPPSHEQYRSLIQKGSIMDHQWGTTFSSYKESRAWSGDKAAVDWSDGTPPDWNATLWAYAHAHRVGLSTLALPRPRWAVATVDVRAGMCNRIMNVLSALAFAMATGRALLFDWVHAPVNQYDSEQMGHSDFLDLFRQPAIRHSYSDALVRFGWTDSDARADSGTVDHTDGEFLRALRFSDLDSKYPQSVVFLKRYDWWAPPLMLNPLYANDVFLGASHGRVFSVLFRFLFSPRESPRDQPACDWLIQRRAAWARETAPLTDFVACGKQHGMDARQGSVLVSDAPAPADAGVASVEAPGCRTGLECDVNAVRQLYLYSQCGHAVLTHTSTFGACIAGLGEIADVYTVRPNGGCHPRPNAILEAGTLDGHPREVSKVMATPPAPDPRLAFVTLLVSPSDKAVRDFQEALRLLHEHFNRHHHYPVVLFVDDPARWQYLQFVVSARVHVVAVNASEWAVPASTGAHPERFRLRSFPDHPGFPVGYRQMSRWAAGFMFGHPALARFEYVLKFDSDTFASAPWTGDPLLAMHKRGAKMGFWISYSDIDDVTDGLWSAFVGFVKARGLSLKQPGLLMDPTGRYRNTNLYGCFVGARTAAFRTDEYAELFRHFDQLGGFFRHRWDEQKIFAFYVALYAVPDEVEFFDYVSVTHQGFTAASKLPLEAVSDSVIKTAFA
jgi:hypothetical protein